MTDTDKTLLGEIGTDLGKLTLWGARWGWRGVKAGTIKAAQNPTEFAPVAIQGMLAAAGYAPEVTGYGWMLYVTAVALAGFFVMENARGFTARAKARSWLRRAYYALTALAALVWLVATAVGAPWALQTYVWGSVAALLAWWSRRLRNHEQAPAEEPAEPETDRNADFAQWWKEEFGDSRTNLRGSYLINLNCDDDADRATIRLGKGTGATTRTAVNAREQIAAARECAVADVVVEPTPDAKAHLASLAIYRRNPIHKAVTFTEPWIDYETGRARIAMFADGRYGHVRLWRPESGVMHELVSGTSDAGKSRYLDLALLLERLAVNPVNGSRLFVSWVADPQQGQSLPNWRKAVDKFVVSEQGTLEMLLLAQAEMYARNKILSELKWTDDKGREREGIEHFDPIWLAEHGVDMPILSVTLEEAHSSLKSSRIKDICEDIAKMGRKCGLKLRLVTQIPSVDQLGYSLILRALLSSHNVICLRTKGDLTGDAIDLPGNPSQLPAVWPDGSSTAGVCYIGGSETRNAEARIIYVKDPYDFIITTTTATINLQPGVEEEVAWLLASLNGEPIEDAPGSQSSERPQDPAAPAPAEDAKALDRMIALMQSRTTPTTSAMFVAQLGIKASTVSETLGRAADKNLVVRLDRGVWDLPGRDHSYYADRENAVPATAAA
jgi:hypothetical protein